MSATEYAVGVSFVIVVALLTRAAARRQQRAQKPASRPSAAPMTLLGVVPPPRDGEHLDDKITSL